MLKSRQRIANERRLAQLEAEVAQERGPTDGWPVVEGPEDLLAARSRGGPCLITPRYSLSPATRARLRALDRLAED